MALVFLYDTEKVWHSTNGEHSQDLGDFIESIKSWNASSGTHGILDKFNPNPSTHSRIKWLEEENIYVDQICVGKIILLDSKLNMGLSRVKRGCLQNIAKNVSLLVQIRQEILRHYLGVMADFIHDIRTPITALNINVAVLQHLSDDLLKASMKNANDNMGNNGDKTKGMSSNIVTNLQRSIDVVSNTISCVNNSIDDYGLLREALIISDSCKVCKNLAPCNIGRVIEKSYSTVHSPDYSRRHLVIDRNYFTSNPVVTYPNVVDMLLSLTMKILLTKYQNVTLCVCGDGHYSDLRKCDKFYRVVDVSNQLNLKDRWRQVPLHPNNRDADCNHIGLENSKVVVTFQFSCSHLVHAITKTSQNKENRVFCGIQRLLDVLHGKMIQNPTKPVQQPPGIANSSGISSVANFNSCEERVSDDNTSSEEYHTGRATCPTRGVHAGHDVYEIIYKIPFDAANISNRLSANGVPHRRNQTLGTPDPVQDISLIPSASGDSNLDLPIVHTTSRVEEGGDVGEAMSDTPPSKLFRKRIETGIEEWKVQSSTASARCSADLRPRLLRKSQSDTLENLSKACPTWAVFEDKEVCETRLSEVPTVLSPSTVRYHNHSIQPTASAVTPSGSCTISASRPAFWNAPSHV